jgi:hypothetical protein
MRDVFGSDDKLTTEELIVRLTAIGEAPWSDYYGRPINPRDLAKLLTPYGVKSTKVKIGGVALQGYRRDQLHDPWKRYLPPIPGQGVEPPEPTELPCSDGVTQVLDTIEVPEPADRGSGTSDPSGTSDGAVTSTVPAVPAVPPPPGVSPLGWALGTARRDP